MIHVSDVLSLSHFHQRDLELDEGQKRPWDTTGGIDEGIKVWIRWKFRTGKVLSRRVIRRGFLERRTLDDENDNLSVLSEIQ